MDESRGTISYKKKKKCLFLFSLLKKCFIIELCNSHLKLSCIHANIYMFFNFIAILQMVESFDLIQCVQEAFGKQTDPQNAGRVHTQLEAV